MKIYNKDNFNQFVTIKVENKFNYAGYDVLSKEEFQKYEIPKYALTAIDYYAGESGGVIWLSQKSKEGSNFNVWEQWQDEGLIQTDTGWTSINHWAEPQLILTFTFDEDFSNLKVNKQ